MNMNKLEKFINRLEKLNISLELAGNYPWIYITKINNKSVSEKFESEHGFIIGYSPIKENQEFKFSDEKEIFKLIKKYVR